MSELNSIIRVTKGLCKYVTYLGCIIGHSVVLITRQLYKSMLIFLFIYIFILHRARLYDIIRCKMFAYVTGLSLGDNKFVLCRMNIVI